jgi:hypothetical protein
MPSPQNGTLTQLPDWHCAPAGHAFPHAPQLCVDEVRSVSHPSLGELLQSANPLLQLARLQLPPTQAPLPLAKEQAAPQLPQLLVVPSCVSQPLV